MKQQNTIENDIISPPPPSLPDPEHKYRILTSLRELYQRGIITTYTIKGQVIIWFEPILFKDNIYISMWFRVFHTVINAIEYNDITYSPKEITEVINRHSTQFRRYDDMEGNLVRTLDSLKEQIQRYVGSTKINTETGIPLLSIQGHGTDKLETLRNYKLITPENPRQFLNEVKFYQVMPEEQWGTN